MRLDENTTLKGAPSNDTMTPFMFTAYDYTYLLFGSLFCTVTMHAHRFHVLVVLVHAMAGLTATRVF